MSEKRQTSSAFERGRLHLKRIPWNSDLMSRYRYPPRIFARHPINEFADGMSFEAATEFLLALATRKLRLGNSVVKSLVDKHASAMDDPITTQLWEIVNEKHSG